MNELISRYPKLKACEKDIKKAISAIIDCYEEGGKLLLCGNGGSCSDCDHIVGELMKGFLKKRPLNEKIKKKMEKNGISLDGYIIEKLQGALPAISLPSFTALNSAFCNDVEPELMYAQCVMGLAKKGDVLIAISTSGNSKNVYRACQVAKALGVTVISLTGEGGGRIAAMAEVAIKAPENETYKVQELHLPIYHHICAKVEAHFFEC